MKINFIYVYFWIKEIKCEGLHLKVPTKMLHIPPEYGGTMNPREVTVLQQKNIRPGYRISAPEKILFDFTY